MTVTINGAGTITGLTSADVPQVNVTTKLLVGGPTTSVGAQGVQVYGLATTGAQNIVQRAYSDTTAGPTLQMVKTRGATATSTNGVISGDTLGVIAFIGSDGTANQGRAAITAYVDDTVLANTVPTAITFTTGSTVGTQQMVITSTGRVGIGTGTPDVSAKLEVNSTTQGVKFPNMTTTQKNAISTPGAGLVIFDLTLAKLCVYSGSAWQTITSV